MLSAGTLRLRYVFPVVSDSSRVGSSTGTPRRNRPARRVWTDCGRTDPGENSPYSDSDVSRPSSPRKKGACAPLSQDISCELFPVFIGHGDSWAVDESMVWYVPFPTLDIEQSFDDKFHTQRAASPLLPFNFHHPPHDNHMSERLLPETAKGAFLGGGWRFTGTDGVDDPAYVFRDFRRGARHFSVVEGRKWRACLGTCRRL